MRQLGEQWIENGRMYKVVLPGLCDGCDFNMGCLQNGGVNCKAGHCVTKQGHVKDLGPINEDGLLPCPFCGEYPKQISNGVEYILDEEIPIFYVEHRCKTIQATEFCYSEQQAKDAWNRRAM